MRRFIPGSTANLAKSRTLKAAAALGLVPTVPYQFTRTSMAPQSYTPDYANTFIPKELVVYQPPTAQLPTSQTTRYWLYMAAFIACMSVFVVQTLPDKDSFARRRFNSEARYNPNESLSNNTKNFMHWSFICWGTGFAGMFSKNDISFNLMAKFVENYVQYQFCTVFRENRTPDGKRDVFFRGETKLEAEKAVRENRSPLLWSLISGEVGLPKIADSTLDHKKELPSGFTRGVISLTTDLDTTLSFGLGEAVLVVAPTTRIASVAQHGTKQNEGGEYEYICGGVHRNDVVGTAKRNTDTQEFIEFVLNPGFTGDIDKLRMDEQMRPLIDLLPDEDPRKSKLYGGIDPAYRAQAEYDNLLAKDEAEHAQQLSDRISVIAGCGFGGNRFFQAAFEASRAPAYDCVGECALPAYEGIPF